MRCPFTRILPEFQLKLELLVAIRSQILPIRRRIKKKKKTYEYLRYTEYVIVEPRRRPLAILPYGTMAAVESTSVVNVLVYAVNIWCLSAAYVKGFEHRLESNSTSNTSTY